jgi:predicted nucleic acid-binding protein
MVTYPDTSFLVPLYVEEEQTILVEQFLAGATDSLVFTPFHRLELRTALRGRVFRQETTPSELRSALQRNNRHLLEGLLQHTPLPWNDILREAERLGEAHLTATGVRSGDLLHVASAAVLGARDFLTFDQRQKKLARLAGLKVKP